MEPYVVPIVPVVQVVREGAGELSRSPSAGSPLNAATKEGDFSACFERMGMGDLEVVDLDGGCVQVDGGVVSGAAPPLPPRPLQFCCADWVPEKDSDDEDVLGAATSTLVTPVDEVKYYQEAASTSRLSISNVSWFSLPGGEDEQDEDDMSHGAPTPDNTPEHTPPEEHQYGPAVGLQLEPGSQLYSTLKVMAEGAREGGSGADTPAGSSGSGGSTLGRVWSRIMGHGGLSKKAKRSEPEVVAVEPTPRCAPVCQQDNSDVDDAVEEDDQHAVAGDPQSIEELEATLEEVCLDGDGDDPVVSYLVEEAEDAARAPVPDRELTVEEVHDDNDDDPPRPPAQKSSGLLSRLFSRTRTSQDVTHSEPTRRADRGGTGKRVKPETPSRERVLQLHRMKPRPPKAGSRSSLPRILSRWLRQGAEGDAGETVIGGVRGGLGAPPALQRTRRAQHQPAKDSAEEALQCKNNFTTLTPAKLCTDSSSQTDSWVQSESPQTDSLELSELSSPYQPCQLTTNV